MTHWIFILSTIWSLGLATETSPQEKAWLDWKQKTFHKHLTSATSFLNAYALESAQAHGHLYLVLGSSRSQSRWVKKKPKNFAAHAEHLGDRIRVQRKGQTLAYLNNAQGKRRRNFEIKNGAIAEVVYGKRNQKMWAYLYDPDQIKSFKGFQFYPFNQQVVVTGRFKSQKPRFVSYKTVQGDPTRVRQIGNVSFNLYGKDFYLPAYNWQPQGEAVNQVALIYTDETRGSETYGGGRELMADLPLGLKDNQEVKLDFNRTVNFYCAHSPFWHCPVGLQKHLPVAVKAGEKLPLSKIRRYR
jgi:uncharacterized protein (DUF1684 family)